MADDDGRGSEAALERSLTRMRAALAAGTDGGMGPPPPVSRLPPEGRLGGLLLALAGSSLLLLAGTGAWPFLGLAVAFGLSGGVFFARGLTQRHLARSRGPAYIGMGARVSSTAVVEPGAVVEMGATVGQGATVRSGALVGMGATVGAHAVLESGAVVSWRDAVRAGATVGADAVVGWGATVGKGVQVPPGMRLRAGRSVAAGWFREHLPGRPVARPLPTARDPADARAAAACDRLRAELPAAPEPVRNLLGASEGTIASLRRTCEDLLRREQALRTEVDPVALGRLDDEKRELEGRLAIATDESLRRSLVGAVAAIEEQRRQRELLRLSADRLQAENMRLVYTPEGLASQFVRLRTAGAEAGRVSAAGLERGVLDLGAELDAIADALEQESKNVPASTPQVRG